MKKKTGWSFFIRRSGLGGQSFPLDKKRKNLHYVILGRPRRNGIYQQATQISKTEKNSNLCTNKKENVRDYACHVMNRDRKESSSKP
jgi:hypothetical protein